MPSSLVILIPTIHFVEKYYVNLHRLLIISGLVVLPFGNGAERTLNNQNIGASIHQLDFNIHSRAHLLRAAPEERRDADHDRCSSPQVAGNVSLT